MNVAWSGVLGDGFFQVIATRSSAEARGNFGGDFVLFFRYHGIQKIGHSQDGGGLGAVLRNAFRGLHFAIHMDRGACRDERRATISHFDFMRFPFV